MVFEHFALNVPEPTSMAHWYTKYMGMKIIRRGERAPYIHVLADSTDRVVMEIYSNRAIQFSEYSTQDPLRFHFAFSVNDAEGEKERLLKVGASLVEEVYLDDGSHLVMLRDPWNIPFQLCQRTTPII